MGVGKRGRRLAEGFCNILRLAPACSRYVLAAEPDRFGVENETGSQQSRRHDVQRQRRSSTAGAGLSNLQSKELLSNSGPISGRRKLYYDFLSSKVLVWSTQLVEEIRGSQRFQ